MKTSIIKVYNSRYGRWEKNAKVVLHWNGFLNSGFSRPVYTNSEGVATVSHASEGEATVYINGKVCGTVRAPASTTITI